MDISITPTKSPETGGVVVGDTETPTPTRIIHPLNTTTKPASIPFANGVLKRHHQHLTVTTTPISYKECLKNHAATLGGHALDGCGEFMPSPNADPNDPTSLKCAACGCHRNFHRRDPEEPPLQLPPQPQPSHVIEYQPHHRHHPLPPPVQQQPPRRNSISPPPISSYYPSSAPHMLLALSGGMQGTVAQHPQQHQQQHENVGGHVVTVSPISRKRFRTKFSQQQKEKMCEFAEKVGWKMQKRDEDLVHEFCNEIGVEKGVFKVWMHNNKNTYGKKDANGNGTATGCPIADNNNDNNNNRHSEDEDKNNEKNNGGSHENVNQYQSGGDNVGGHVGTNGSSSSS